MPLLTLSRPLSRRRTASAVAAIALAVGGVAVGAATMPEHSRTGTFASAADLGAFCNEVIASPQPGIESCAHYDQAPPGVDVTKPVATAVLEARKGAAAAAVKAAQDEGVPVAAQLAATTDRVPCDGDGTSGYRVQAIYVVASGSANRYPAVSDQIKQWAAGVNTVFNLSAAKTGGTRDVRYVTAPNGDGTCSPTVLNVTVPAGSFASFGATVTAMRNLGYTSSQRKYLLWVDGTGQCGIAQTYTDSKSTQDNYNNGYAAQFARVDTGCWGQSASVEAHELAHTMGSVQGDAPHATAAGHCWDESDRMCYADGGGKAMQQVCPSDQEVLFDCNNDDYYSTFPAGGTYLATHWNTANSRWLIGGGDGVGGGSPGVPTTLGGTMTVNNPAVPGLPTQASLSLEVPAGRTASIAWTSARKDCLFSAPTAAQTNVTCDAKTPTNTTVTVTITDSTGAKLVRTTPLTFSTSARTAQPSVKIDGSAAAYTACPTGKGILTAKVLDQASGAVVKGLTVAWFRKVGTANPVQVGTAATSADGVATSAAALMTAGTYYAKTTATAAFPSVTTSNVAVSVASAACTTALTSSVDDNDVVAARPVTVSGALTRTLPGGGATSPAAGERVAIYTQVPGATTWTSAASTTTKADGTYSVAIKPLVSVTVQARFLAHTGFAASTAASTPVTVSPWTTALTVTPSATEVMGAAPLTLTGKLTQSDGSATSALPSTAVQVIYPVAGGKTATASGSTKADGTYSVVVKPTASGTITVKYVGKTGWIGTSVTQAVTVDEWASALTMSASRNATTGVVSVTGTLKVTDKAGVVTPKSAGSIRVTYQVSATRTATATATTKADGSFSVSVKPGATGAVTASWLGIAGYAPATSSPVTITVP